MSEKLEEFRQKLAESKKQKEKAFDKLTGFVKGMKARGGLSQMDENFIGLFELILNGFNNLWTDVGSLFDGEIAIAEAINQLKTKVKELEEGIFQLRTTLDKLSELK